MIKFFQIIFISLIINSLLFGEEEVYKYNFNLDTTITGAVFTEGNIFPNAETTFISILLKTKHEKRNESVKFFSSSYDSLYEIKLGKDQKVGWRPLLFDFDNDSFDEIVFTIKEPNKLWFLYFDPSNSPIIKTKIFEIPINEKNIGTIECRISPAQLDDDNFHEIIVRFGGRILSTNGMWAADIEEKKIFWKFLSAERTLLNKPLNFFNKDSSLLIYSVDAGSLEKYNTTYSNGAFFIKKPGKDVKILNDSFEEIKSAIIDTNSEDYSTDSLAYIRAIDRNNNVLWERMVGTLSTKTHIDSVTINNRKKIIFSSFSQELNSKKPSYIEIIDPSSGKTEKKVEVIGRIRDLFVTNKRLYVTFYNKSLTEFDFNLNVINSIKTDYSYMPLAKYKDMLIFKEGSGIVQSLTILDSNLTKKAKMITRGLYNFFPTHNLVSIYNSSTKESKIYSIVEIPWYNRIPQEKLQQLSLAILVILLFVSLFWVSSLRQSAKKIQLQKKEIEEAHKELKRTTSKLIRAEKLAVYGTIASGIAHEINSPLGAIINSAQRISGDPESNFNQNVALIEKAGKKSKAIIEKLLVGARKEVDSNSAKLMETVNDWMELSQKQFDNLGIELNFDLICNKKLAIGSLELNQIITNLLFNARDAIMEANSDIKEIRLSSKSKNNYCHIFVNDSGNGFSEEQLKNPFEAFETTKEVGKGTGLGLWVVKSILESVKGNIKIGNREQGAEIEVIIPFFEETKENN